MGDLVPGAEPAVVRASDGALWVDPIDPFGQRAGPSIVVREVEGDVTALAAEGAPTPWLAWIEGGLAHAARLPSPATPLAAVVVDDAFVDGVGILPDDEGSVLLHATRTRLAATRLCVTR